MRAGLSKLLQVITLALFCAGSIGAPAAQAFTLEQRKELELRTFYDATDLNLCTGGSAASAGGGSGSSGSGSGSGSATGKVYVIGDSITEGTSSQLTTSLKGKGFSDVVINGVSSRRLSSGASNIDGVTVFQNDKAKWSDASTIIIELGTNNGVSGANIAKIVDLAKTSKAKLYWVNIGVNNAVRKGTPIDTGPINKLLGDAAGKGGFSIIDWASVVKQHPEYILKDDGLGVHPAGAGKAGFADTVAGGVGGTSSSSGDTGSGNVSCSDAAVVSTTDLSGSDNAQKIWNYLRAKGLSPIQVAGIMGNLERESGYNPGSEEKTPNLNKGYGIVQWTAGRRTKLENYAKAQGKPANDLGMQLDFMWLELTTGYKNSTLTPLQGTSSLEEAVHIVLYNYEIPADKEGGMRKSINMALNVLKNSWAK